MARVSQTLVDQQLEEIAALIAEHPAGINRATLSRKYTERYGRKLLRRTLLRRLEELVERRQVHTSGSSWNMEYLSSPRSAQGMPQNVHTLAMSAAAAPQIAPHIKEQAAATGEAANEVYVPISEEGAEIRALVRRPIMYRSPVGYDRHFLNRYVPGTTWYIPPALRERLHERGRTPGADRPAGTYARDIFGRLLIDLAWASSRLEGNTYTRLDTQNLLEFGQRAEGKDASDTQMILNHKRAIEFLVDDAEAVAFDRRTLLTLHAALADTLVTDPQDEGSLRRQLVNITGTSYTPMAIPQVIEECFDVLLAKVTAIPDPFEQAFFVMVHIPYLQPFIDVNKRTSRLAANIPLIRANLCPLSFIDIPERSYIDGTLGVYELTRIELLRDLFVWAYERSCDQYRVIRDALGQPDPLRLRYRTELEQIVQETVHAGAAPRVAGLRSWASDHNVPEPDVEGFAERALSILLNLTEGSVGRYRIRPSEFIAWRSRFAPKRSH